MPKTLSPPPSEPDIRRIVLRYFYDRYRNARSLGSSKTGAAATISVVQRELKAEHGLSQQEVQRAMTYLLSQGYIVETKTVKKITAKSGMVLDQVTCSFKIDASGIDHIEGPSPFTRDPFQGIKIENIERSIITVGDGNRVDARFEEAGTALSSLREAVESLADAQDEAKLELLQNIGTIEAQIALQTPNKTIIRCALETIKATGISVGLAANVATVVDHLRALVE